MARPAPDNETLAATFARTSVLLELLGDNPHRVRSYASVARILEDLPHPAAQMLADGTLTDVKGIGEGTAARVREILETGRLGVLAEAEAQVPPGLLELLEVEGLGPKRVRAIWKTLHVTSLVELEYACHENRLRDLDGFGEKSQQNVLKGLGFLKRSRGRRLLSQARAAAERCLNRLQRDPAALRLAVTGDVRRMVSTVEGADLLATAHDDDALLATFVGMGFVEQVVERTPSSARVVLDDGTPVSLTVVPETAYFAALFLRTGSEAHVARVAAAVERRGRRLSERGLLEGRHVVRLEDEDDVYAAAGLPPVPPELRDEAAPAPAPDDLVHARDLRGVLHLHTTWSDGSYSIREMAERAGQLGFAWIAVCDHSEAAAYAKGLSPDRVRAQWDEIDALNAAGDLPVAILKGIETDILPDGDLDLPAKVLAGFDVVVASVHSALRQPRDVMTDRLVRAVSHPMIHVLGHPTGRLLLGREASAFDLDRVLAACAQHGTAVECNANPHRLDLDEAGLARALAHGVKVAIDPDAHDLRGLEDVVYGVGTARRARVRRADVLTALDADAFRAWCAARRGKPAP